MSGAAAVFVLLSLTTTATAGNFPDTLNRCTQIVQDGREHGWAAPVAPRKLVTSRHVTKPEPVRWMLHGDSGGAVVTWRSKGDEFTALAALTTETSVEAIPLATQAPDIGDTVYYAGYIVPGWRPTIMRGWVLGVDANGLLQIDGLAMPGTSGGCVVNDAGELVGIMAVSANPAGQRLEKPDAAALFAELSRRANVRAIAYAVPVADFPREARP